MDISLIDKIGLVFQYVFSSFLSIEMFLFGLLLFCLLLFNIKRKSKIVSVATVSIYLGFFIGVVVSYSDYVRLCIDSFIKGIMNYIYFPSTIAYFFIILFVIFALVRTVFCKKITIFKRVFNYVFFGIIFFLFMSFITIATTNGLQLVDITTLYQNDTVLALIQLSNLLLLVWGVFTVFYQLFQYFKRKYDEKIDS